MSGITIVDVAAPPRALGMAAVPMTLPSVWRRSSRRLVGHLETWPAPRSSV